jgi:pimeloyl-ACP methyl ester carboxylesterase
MSKTLIAGEQKVEYELIGHGKPCIIFLNGFGARIASWNKVIPDIADVGTLLLYNRSGIGKSSKATTKQTGDVVIATLREVLKSLQLEPPYILVGWSIGGLFVNLFARMYPSETQAVVFVESSHPDEDRVLLPQAPPLALMLYRLQMSIFRLLPNSGNWELSLFEESGELVRGAGVFPEIPVVVLTGAKTSWQRPKSLQEAHVALHGELAALTSSGRHVVTIKSGHLLTFTEPELVIDAIRSVISKS